MLDVVELHGHFIQVSFLLFPLWEYLYWYSHLWSVIFLKLELLDYFNSAALIETERLWSSKSLKMSG